jgi:transcriptional regulator with XRE-family HTH domain
MLSGFFYAQQNSADLFLIAGAFINFAKGRIPMIESILLLLFIVATPFLLLFLLFTDRFHTPCAAQTEKTVWDQFHPNIVELAKSKVKVNGQYRGTAIYFACKNYQKQLDEGRLTFRQVEGVSKPIFKSEFKQWRDRLKLSQPEAATILGITLHQVKEFENGKGLDQTTRLATVAIESFYIQVDEESKNHYPRTLADRRAHFSKLLNGQGVKHIHTKECLYAADNK